MFIFNQHHWPYLFFMNTQDFSYYITTWYTKFGMKTLVSNTFLNMLNIMPTVFANQLQNIISSSGCTTCFWIALSEYRVKFSANRNSDISSELRLPKNSCIIGSCNVTFYMFFEIPNFWANIKINFFNFLSTFLTIIHDLPRGI